MPLQAGLRAAGRGALDGAAARLANVTHTYESLRWRAAHARWPGEYAVASFARLQVGLHWAAITPTTDTNGPGRAVLRWTLGALRARPWTVLDILATLCKQTFSLKPPGGISTMELSSS